MALRGDKITIPTVSALYIVYIAYNIMQHIRFAIYSIIFLGYCQSFMLLSVSNSWILTAYPEK